VHSTVLLPISVNTAHIVIYIQCLWKRTNQPGLEIKIVQKKKKYSKSLLQQLGYGMPQMDIYRNQSEHFFKKIKQLICETVCCLDTVVMSFKELQQRYSGNDISGTGLESNAPSMI